MSEASFKIETMSQQRSSDSGLKSTLKWVGGKKRISKEIVSFFPQKFGTYFEPFLGGGSVFLEAQPPKSNLSDLNDSLINYFKFLRDEPDALMHSAVRLQDKFNSLDTAEEKKTFYYEVRSQFNSLRRDSSLESALRFLFLNKTAFNGLFRENSKGEFNVPFNNKDVLSLFDSSNFLENSKALQGATLQTSTFTTAVEAAQEGDLVYFDPPYVPLSTTSAFTGYTRAPFGPAKQAELRDIARALVSKGATVVLSNSYSSEVETLYQGFELHELRINRLVAAKSNSRGSISEYLIVGHPNGG